MSGKMQNHPEHTSLRICAAQRVFEKLQGHPKMANSTRSRQTIWLPSEVTSHDAQIEFPESDECSVTLSIFLDANTPTIGQVEMALWKNGKLFEQPFGSFNGTKSFGLFDIDKMVSMLRRLSRATQRTKKNRREKWPRFPPMALPGFKVPRSPSADFLQFESNPTSIGHLAVALQKTGKILPCSQDPGAPASIPATELRCIGGAQVLVSRVQRHPDIAQLGSSIVFPSEVTSHCVRIEFPKSDGLSVTLSTFVDAIVTSIGQVEMALWENGKLVDELCGESVDTKWFGLSDIDQIVTVLTRLSKMAE
jgi:hypothetical protein